MGERREREGGEGKEGEDDTPANHREMTLQLPNDRTLFRIVESAEPSSRADADNTQSQVGFVD